MCPPVPCRGISLYLVIYLQGHAEISSNTSSPLLVSFEFSLGGVQEERNRNPCLTEQKKKKVFVFCCSEVSFHAKHGVCNSYVIKKT